MGDETKTQKNDTADILTTIQITSPKADLASYGVSKKYDRKLYDSAAQKKRAKDLAFGDKKTIRDKNGNLLHRDHNAAKRKYGQLIYAKHAAEPDHIDSLKEIHKRHRKKLFLTDKDIREIANRDSNLQMIDKSTNASKGGMSAGKRFVRDTDTPIPERLHHAGDEIKAQIETDVLITQRQVKNITLELKQGAQDALAASVVPLVIRGTQDLVKVANGEMEPLDAVKDIGTLGVSIAASGGGYRVVTSAVSQVLSKGTNDVVAKFANVHQIGNILVVSTIIAKAAGRYLAGEVDASGFFDEISKDGIGLIAGMLASEVASILVAGASAPVLAALIASNICTEIYEQTKRLKEEKKDNEAIRRIADDAYQSIQQQKEELISLLNEDHERWVQSMNEIFQEIAIGITSNDTQRTAKNLHRLAKTFDQDVKLYDTVDQGANALLSMRNGTAKDLIWG